MGSAQDSQPLLPPPPDAQTSHPPSLQCFHCFLPTPTYISCQGQYVQQNPTITSLSSNIPAPLPSCSYIQPPGKEKLNQNKIVEPGGVSPRVLKACADQVCGILQHCCDLSLSQEKVPTLWKTYWMVMLPKTEDQLLSHHLLSKPGEIGADPFKTSSENLSVYRLQVGVDSAIIYLLQLSLSQMDKAGSCCLISQVPLIQSSLSHWERSSLRFRQTPTLLTFRTTLSLVIFRSSQTGNTVYRVVQYTLGDQWTDNNTNELIKLMVLHYMYMSS